MKARIEEVGTYDNLPDDGAPAVVYHVMDEDAYYVGDGIHPESFYTQVTLEDLPSWFVNMWGVPVSLSS